MNRLGAMAVATVALGIVAGACGVGSGGEFQRINSDDLAGLDETTTTTSTTTTTTPAVPPSSVQTTIGQTTTTIAIEPVELYFLDGDQLAPISIDLARDPSASRVLAALEAGRPQGDIGIGLRSVIPPNLVTSVTESGAGYASVDFASAAFERIEPIDQRIAIAQIVLTLTRRPGIGQVQFSVDGEPLAVPGEDNVQTEPGELVSRQDYESLLLEPALEPETTPPTSPPPSPPTSAVETVPPTTPPTNTPPPT